MMDECLRAGGLTTNQVGYNLFDRRMEAAVLPYCQKHGIGFMAYGSLAYGLLSGGLTPDTTFLSWDWRSTGKAFGLPLFQREDFLRELRVVERLKKLAASHGKTVAQMAIAWVLGNPAVTVALVGTRTVGELEEDIAALDWRLAPADRAEIDRIFAAEGAPTYRDAPQAVGR
jgi:aryl-alcohol dehydrogenase-like predicted oxidoreductase